MDEGTSQRYSQTVAEVFNDMAVSVTTPAMEMVGDACTFSLKVAVMVTKPVVMRLSESLVVRVTRGPQTAPQLGCFALLFKNPEAVPVSKPVGFELRLVTHHSDKS